MKSPALRLILVLCALLTLAACAPIPQPEALPQPQPAATAVPTTAPAAIANPASQNCVAKGGKLAIEERAGLGQLGVCYFEDNRQCEEWALMRGECPVGGVKVTGYATAAARFCAISGGKYTITGNSGQPNEQGTCALPGGGQCDADAYYQGICPATSSSASPTEDASTRPTLKAPPEEVCNGMAQALAEALSRAATNHEIVEVTQSATTLTEPASMETGPACRAEAKGTGEQFAAPGVVMKEITAVLTGGGWKEDVHLAAGGPTGIGSGFWSGQVVCLAGVMWLPDPAANCPKDQPISACTLTPAQKLYTIRLDCAQG